MTTAAIPRPVADDFPPYFATYIDKVPAGDVLELLRTQIDDTIRTLSKVKEKDAGYRYAPGKWSIKEVVEHVVDTERIFVYRALCFARGEKQSLPGFEENDYAANSGSDQKPLLDILNELKTQRASTIAFFSGVPADALKRRGTANNREYAMYSIPYIVAGHERHHLGVLKERYLSKLA